MSAFGKEKNTGASNEGNAPELTDDQLRNLLAPLAERPFLTDEEKAAVLARLKETMQKQGLKFPAPRR